MFEKEVHKTEPVSYITFESVTTRFERTIRRLWILALLEFFVLIVSNAVWILHQ